MTRSALELVVTAHVDGNEQSRRAIEKYVERYGGRYEGAVAELASAVRYHR